MKAFLSLSLLLFSLWTSAASAEDQKPNIVFIIADDLGWADVGFHGGNAPTPHIDKLAATGLELLQHYVAPVCSPTRTGLMTGRYWSRFDVTSPTNRRVLPWETVTLPRALQTVGYQTCLTGKWHLGSKPEWGPNHFGFDHSYGSLAGGIGPWNHRYKKGPYSLTWHRNERLLEEPGHVTDLITKEAVDWIALQGDQQPFFLYVPFTAVHVPIKEPQEWLARVPATIPAGVSRQYAACIMHLDNAVGQIVDALKKSGLRNNTLLVFTSDNGGCTAENNNARYPADDYPSGRLPGNNAPLRGQKGDLYEGGIRVPTIASWPGKLKPGKSRVPTHITDWMPTLSQLAGYLPKNDLKWDGSDIWPSLTGKSPRDSHLLYWAGNDFLSSAVREGDWKLIVYQREGDNEVELFNLAEDPNENSNLAATFLDRVANLQRLMTKISSSDGDSAVKE